MNRNIRLVYIHNFLTDFRFQTPYLIIFFNQILGSYAAGMSILAVESISSAIMDIPTGFISDRIGRKITLMFGSICAAAGIGCYAIADNIFWLLIGAVLNGLSFCLFSGNNNALLYETLKTDGLEAEYHHYQGRTSSMFQLALGISALCSSLFTPFGLRFIFILGIVPQLLAVCVSLFFKEPKTHTFTKHAGLAHFKISFLKVCKNPRLRLLMIGQAISYGAGEATFNFRNAFINVLWPVWAIGIYRCLNNLGGFLGFWFSGRIIDRFTAPYILVIAEAYWFCSQTIAVIISNVISPVIFLTGATIYGPFLVARDKLLQADFADEQRATMGSVASFAGSLFYAVIALGIGLVSDRWGPALGVGFGATVSALSLPVYVWLFRKHFSVIEQGG